MSVLREAGTATPVAASEPSPLRSRHALVTGAARGIGAEIARHLASEGATLSLLGRDFAALSQLADSLPGPRHGVVLADVGQHASIVAAFEQAKAARGPISILVNNAGQAESAPFMTTSLELWERMVRVNLTGSFLCAQAALPDMIEARWGRIVNIASTAGQKGYAYVAAYAAAKHGVIGMTRSLALEVATKGVTVNAVCPGYTETDILRASIANVVAKTGRTEQEARATFASGNPQRRIVLPAEVADAVRWLCGEGASSITGQSISVSGGEIT